jgi:peptidyl-prolyl cis-trans isomerase C
VDNNRVFGKLMIRICKLLPVLILAQGPILLGGTVFAQPQPSASPLAPGDLSKPIFDTTKSEYETSGADLRGAATIVAEVDGRAITLGEVSDAIRAQSSNVANMPFDTLFPAVLRQLVQRMALTLKAQRLGVDADPIIKRRVQAAADQTLADEFLHREVNKTITDAMVRERYKRDIADKPGQDEVRASIIMTRTEPEAAALIEALTKGADFETLARQSSKDTSAVVGGDLGFARRSSLNAEIGAVAFALPVGQTSAHPVWSSGAWFIVKVNARRPSPTPSFFEMRAALRQAMIRAESPGMIKEALDAVMLREYGFTGKEGEKDSSSR